MKTDNHLELIKDNNPHIWEADCIPNIIKVNSIYV